MHIKRIHANNVKIVYQTEDSAWFSCDECSYSTDIEQLLNLHKKRVHSSARKTSNPRAKKLKLDAVCDLVEDSDSDSREQEPEFVNCGTDFIEEDEIDIDEEGTTDTVAIKKEVLEVFPSFN